MHPIGIELSPEFFICLMVLSAPIWLPIVFAAFVAGRRRMNLRLLFVFITIEAISLGALSFAISVAAGIAK
jgi:hypothetical protein